MQIIVLYNLKLYTLYEYMYTVHRKEPDPLVDMANSIWEKGGKCQRKGKKEER
jgi:hypothetical protein